MIKRVALTIVMLVLPTATAAAHVERSAYWPDPAADTDVRPAAGGAVPKIRSLSSALQTKRPGTTRVVCRQDSLSRLKRSIAAARKDGYDIRPTDHRSLSARQGRALMRTNRRLRRLCRYDEIQPAVTASANNDRVVVMPGLYTEPTARAQPTNDPACAQDLVKNDVGETGALSYAYQSHCPNDQNLIAVMGRAVGPGSDPDPPFPDRRGIPNLGACIRCNLQLEGSGVGAGDVVVEAGDAAAGNGGPSGAGHKKDVGIRADRADGFVLRNLTVRHATEHGIYVLESDGYMLDRFKAFYSGAYGTLTFAEDHGVQQNCEAAGHGDSGLYPGAPAETGAQRAAGTEFRYNQEVRFCDARRNLAGYSATNGNAVWIHDNNFYDNSLGSNTDVVTAPGHPGFPGDSELFENNNYYSNNFNAYAASSDVKPIFPYPIGTGAWIAGGNDHIVRGNRFWDNWRRGVMLFSAPDVLICGPLIGVIVEGCDALRFSTSHGNRVHDNVMGADPKGAPAPNGVDFWWDAFPGSRGNCWYRNTGPARITSAPASLPGCANGTRPAESLGLGDVVNQAELVICLVAFTSERYDPATCPWFRTPPRPGSRAARQDRAERASDAAGAQRVLGEFCRALTIANPTCSPFAAGLRAAGVRLDPGLAALQAASPRSQTPAGGLVSAVPGSRRLLSLFSCADWKRADGPTRASVLRRLAAFTSGPIAVDGVAGARGTALTEQQGATFFDRRCNSGLPDSLALYKMYGYAAAFAGGPG